MHSFIHSFTHTFINLFIYSLLRLYIYLFNLNLYIRSFFHTLIDSFAPAEITGQISKRRMSGKSRQICQLQFLKIRQVLVEYLPKKALGAKLGCYNLIFFPTPTIFNLDLLLQNFRPLLSFLT